MTKPFCHFIYIPLFKPSCLKRLWTNKKLIKIFCIKGCNITVGWFSIFFWAKIIFFCIIQAITLNLIFGKWMNFLEIWFRSFFSARRGVFPSKWVIHQLFNSAPRKFKNLGTDTFIESRITKIFFSYVKMYMQWKCEVPSRIYKMFSIANF